MDGERELSKTLRSRMSPNLTKPGLPNYTGTDEGWALWVHHGEPVEYCTSFRERIAYIIAEKPVDERALRMAALTVLPLAAILPAFDQAKAAYDQAWIVYRQAQPALNQASTVSNQAWIVYSQAWDAYRWDAYRQARTALIQAQDASNQAWTAYRQAQPALYRRALATQYAPEIPHRDGVLDFAAWRKRTRTSCAGN